MDNLLKAHGKDSLPAEEQARLGVLPDTLPLETIVRLWTEDSSGRKALTTALQNAIQKGALEADVHEEDRVIARPSKWVTPRARPITQTVQKIQIRRDALRVFLEAAGDWPLPAESLLASWWGPPAPRPRVSTTRETRLKVAVRSARDALVLKLKREPSAAEVIRYLEEDPLGIIVDSKEKTLVWEDSEGVFHDTKHKTVSNMLSNIRKG